MAFGDASRSDGLVGLERSIEVRRSCALAHVQVCCNECLKLLAGPVAGAFEVPVSRVAVLNPAHQVDMVSPGHATCGSVEDRLIGEYREELFDRVKDGAQHAVEQGKTAIADAAAQAAKTATKEAMGGTSSPQSQRGSVDRSASPTQNGI